MCQYATDLVTDQEETRDTKVILHTKHALDESRNIVKIGSPPLDADVILLVRALLSEDSEGKVLD